MSSWDELLAEIFRTVRRQRVVIQLHEVVSSHHVTGNYDYLLQVEVADLPAYEDFHASRLANLPGVAAVPATSP